MSELEEIYDGTPDERAFMGSRKIEQCAVSNMTTDQAIELGIGSMQRLMELIKEKGTEGDEYAGMFNLYYRLERAADKLWNLKESRT